MTLNYEEEGEVKLPVDCEGLAKEVIEAGATRLGASAGVAILEDWAE